jgi:hypothetical protein
VAGGARRLEAGAALEEDEVRAVGPVGVGDLAGEDGDALAVGPGVIERDLELVLGHHQARRRGRDGHRTVLPRRWWMTSSRFLPS